MLSRLARASSVMRASLNGNWMLSYWQPMFRDAFTASVQRPETHDMPPLQSELVAQASGSTQRLFVHFMPSPQSPSSLHSVWQRPERQTLLSRQSAFVVHS